MFIKYGTFDIHRLQAPLHPLTIASFVLLYYNENVLGMEDLGFVECLTIGSDPGLSKGPHT